MNLLEFKNSKYGKKIKFILIRQNKPKSKKDFELLEKGLNNTHRQLTFNRYFKRNNQKELAEYIKAINY